MSYDRTYGTLIEAHAALRITAVSATWLRFFAPLTASCLPNPWPPITAPL